MTDIHLYQIAYSKETLENIEPGYKVLDNLDNLRPDWYEYWPIRNFLLNDNLNDSDYYGFFSPKFKNKTGLDYNQVYDYISSKIDSVDVFLFSPQFDMGAFFLNAVEQGEAFDSGFKDAFQKFLEEIGFYVDLNSLIMDSGNIVFSNYFVAKPSFWREWNKFANALFKIAEDETHPLEKIIKYQTTYPGQVQRKVFIQERLASLILATQPQWKTAIKNPMKMAWSALPTSQFTREAVISDALKRSYILTGFPEYLSVFNDIRKKVFNI